MAVYRGIAFPFGRSQTAIPAAVTDDELIKQSIIQIVTTGRGERVMRPDFGSSAFAFVFENNNQILAELIRDEITAAVAKFEPRAIIQNVFVTRDDSQVVVTINYTVTLTGEQDSVAIAVPSNSP